MALRRTIPLLRPLLRSAGRPTALAAARTVPFLQQPRILAVASQRFYSVPVDDKIGFPNVQAFHQACDVTLEALLDQMEDLSENLPPSFTEADSVDISLSTGVLKVALGKYGTYVINKQTPNQQIWLSSPKSGPKRYDFHPASNSWVYSHDGVSLHERLSQEISEVVGTKVTFSPPDAS